MPLSTRGAKPFLFVSPGMKHFDASMFASYKSLWVPAALAGRMYREHEGLRARCDGVPAWGGLG
jgi:hypothetical protein